MLKQMASRTLCVSMPHVSAYDVHRDRRVETEVKEIVTCDVCNRVLQRGAWVDGEKLLCRECKTNRAVYQDHIDREKRMVMVSAVEPDDRLPTYKEARMLTIPAIRGMFNA